MGHAKGKRKHKWWEKVWNKHSPKETITWLHSDHLDTPRTATNEKAETVWRWNGNAFGDSRPVIIKPGKDKKHRAKEKKDKGFINLRFPGQYYDAESKQ